MNRNIEKPSPEAKALSLFLMAHKAVKPIYKEQSKYMNRQWELVKTDELSKKQYMAEVQDMLTSYGGYSEVLEKTVKYYIEKTGEWKLKGDDKYCQDAKKIADEILGK
jgi:hypothetical protein